MATIALREHLQSTLHGFQQGSLKRNALALLGQLGYRSDKQIDLEPNTVATFKDTFEVPEHVTFNDEKALVEQWQSVNFLFQLAGDDLAIGGQLPLVRSQCGGYVGGSVAVVPVLCHSPARTRQTLHPH
jgi:hypothetical protein